MCRRIVQFVLIGIAILSIVSVFVPWTRLFFLSSETETHWLMARVLALPLFGLCLFGATALGSHGSHGSDGSHAQHRPR